MTAAPVNETPAPLMDGLQFFASVIQSIAWPLTILVIILIFRKQLLTAFSKLTSFKYGDFEAKFEARMGKAEEELLALPPLEKSEIFPARDSKDENRILFSRRAIAAPHLRILDAWMAVARAIRSLAQKKKIGASDRTMPFEMARLLHDRGHIDDHLLRLINDLRQLRNIAVHSMAADQISEEQADRYVETAEEVVLRLGSL